jgi:hypothetical protein
MQLAHDLSLRCVVGSSPRAHFMLFAKRIQFGSIRDTV